MARPARASRGMTVKLGVIAMSKKTIGALMRAPRRTSARLAAERGQHH